MKRPPVALANLPVSARACVLRCRGGGQRGEVGSASGAARETTTQIAAVMIVYRHYPYCTVEVAHGRALDALPIARLIKGKLQPCNRRHGHAEVLVLYKTPNLSHCDGWE